MILCAELNFRIEIRFPYLYWVSAYQLVADMICTLSSGLECATAYPIGSELSENLGSEAEKETSRLGRKINLGHLDLQTKG